MKFPYRREPSVGSQAHPGRRVVYRPRIRIRLTHKNRSIDLLALIDSGADDCLFPLEVAESLQLELNPENTNQYGGIGQGQITAVFGTITVEVGGWPFKLYAGFTDSPSVIPILGQDGFFTLFEVRFNLTAGVIELRPIR